ncbi:MAG: hypothetical protein NMK33_06400 (plasmid) [Candidatus Cardinium sp.]|nr:MAG: hypothetical protein NMK33_06400 [Candidatus Cardinium sp.]
MYDSLSLIRNKFYNKSLSYFLCYLFLGCFVYGCGNTSRYNNGITDSNIARCDGYSSEKEIIPILHLDQANELIYTAAIKGDVGFIQSFLEQGINPNELDRIIHPKSECCTCHEDTIKYLFNRYNKSDKYGNTLLHNNFDNINFIRNLFENHKTTSLHHHYRSIVVNLEQKNNEGLTPIDLVTISGNTYLLKKAFKHLNMYNCTIQYYILQRAINLAEKQIKNEANIEKCEQIKTAIEVIKEYIKHKNNEYQIEENSKLHTAAEKNDISFFQSFINSDKNIDTLIWYNDKIEDLKIQNKKGYTVFHILAENGRVDICRMILDWLQKLPFSCSEIVKCKYR